MVAIYILAGIGGLCLLGLVGMVLLFIFSSAPDPEENEKEEKTYICALTDCNCICVDGQGNCSTCLVREEAEKIGNR